MMAEKVYKTVILIVLVVISLTLIYSNLNRSGDSWEYMVLKYVPYNLPDRTGEGAFLATTIDISESELDRYGQQGWELVAAYTEIETAFPNFGNPSYVTGLQPNVRPQAVTLIFKRRMSKRAH